LSWLQSLVLKFLGLATFSVSKLKVPNLVESLIFENRVSHYISMKNTDHFGGFSGILFYLERSVEYARYQRLLFTPVFGDYFTSLYNVLKV